MAAGVELATAYVSVTVSAKGISQNLKREIGDPTDKAARDAGTALEEGIGGGATRGASAAKLALSAIGSAAVLSGLNRAKDAASGLQQAVGGTAAVFGEASEAVDDFAESAAESVGLSERVTRELTSQLGASLKGYGFAVDEAAAKSIELTTIGADLAATFGGTTADAVGALSSALRGEFDPLERYGIALRQSAIDAEAVELGLVGAGEEVDAMARAQAALTLITEGSADAQGQFARESDSAAGQAQIAAAQMENSAANLGEALLPIYAKISETVGTVAEVFAQLPSSVQTGILALAGVVAVAGPLTNLVGLYRSFTPLVAANTVAVEVNTVATNSAVGVQNLYAASTARSAAATALLSTALKVAAVAFAGYAIGAGVVARSRQEAADAGEEEARQVAETIDQMGTYQEFQDQVNASIGRYNELVDDASSGADIFANDDIAQYTHQLGPLLENYQALNDVILAYAEETGDADEATRLFAGRADEAAALLAEGYTPQQAAAELAVSSRADAERDATTRTEAFGDATADAAAAAKELAEQITAAHEAQIALVEGTLGSIDAELGLESAMLNTAEQISELEAVYADSEATAQDRQQAVIDATNTAIAQGDAAVAAAEAQNGDISLSAEETARIQRGALASIADDLAPDSPLRARLEDYIARLDAVPEQIATQIALEVELRNDRFGVLSPYFDQSLVTRGTTPRALGGPMVAGESYLFEGHPEILTMGPGMTSGQVTPLADVLAPATSSGGDTYFISGPDPDWAQHEVERVNRRRELMNAGGW